MLAAKVIDTIMREDFDFTCCLWFFSGSRGVHCWVCDPEARSMNNEMRNSVAHYINLNIGNENSKNFVISYPLHPHLKRAYAMLEPKFSELIVEGQNILSIEKHRAKFLSYLDLDLSRKVS